MERNDGTTDFGTSAGQTDASGISGAGTTDSATERVSETGSALRERAGAAKNKLADVLESGAGRLRERSAATNGPTLAGATDAGTTPIASDGKVTRVSERVAGGMQASAEWLRDADLDSLRADVEQQVRDHPGRTLLIAAGLGYLMGRAFRGSQ
jgi:ElaB/YqjD/DUF883 family membrane-anchored ribosome-binding protein